MHFRGKLRLRSSSFSTAANFQVLVSCVAAQRRSFTLRGLQRELRLVDAVSADFQQKRSLLRRRYAALNATFMGDNLLLETIFF